MFNFKLFFFVNYDYDDEGDVIMENYETDDDGDIIMD